MKPEHVNYYQQLLIEGTAKGAFSKEMQFRLEQLLFEYESISRSLGMMLPTMSSLIDKATDDNDAEYNLALEMMKECS